MNINAPRNMKNIHEYERVNYLRSKFQINGIVKSFRLFLKIFENEMGGPHFWNFNKLVFGDIYKFWFT